jgi:lysine 2,3-aminomutase
MCSEPLKPSPDASYETVQNETKDEDFWRSLKPFSTVKREQFLDHKWQLAQSISNPGALSQFLRDVSSSAFAQDVEAGLAVSPMQIRVTPYILSLINWQEPMSDPLRRQFIPIGSEFEREHPRCTFDSLNEQEDSPAPALTRRYPDKALFLPTTVCPVYCQFCTRSYAVGPPTTVLIKTRVPNRSDEWGTALSYLSAHPEIQDVVISGGDAIMLSHDSLVAILDALLAIPHLHRLRFATKAISVLPMKILSDNRWRDTLLHYSNRARREGKELAIHTHINHPSELTWITTEAVRPLTAEGVTIRNQSVLLRGVNDTIHISRALIRRLGNLSIHPYYLYQADLAPGTSHLRTPLSTAISLSKQLQGWTAGFNTPRVIVDLPGGGGKRDVTSHEYYDADSGVSLFTAPAVKPNRLFYYFDPLSALIETSAQEWLSPGGEMRILDRVRRRAGFEPETCGRASL